MENLYIPESPAKDTPAIRFDFEKGILEISGKSFPENAREFFEPATNWIKTFINVSKKDLVVNFKMSYFNTGTSRVFYELLGVLEDYRLLKKGKVSVNWYYDKNDKDMLEYGEDFEDNLELPFKYIPY